MSRVSFYLILNRFPTMDFLPIVILVSIISVSRPTFYLLSMRRVDGTPMRPGSLDRSRTRVRPSSHTTRQPTSFFRIARTTGKMRGHVQTVILSFLLPIFGGILFLDRKPRLCGRISQTGDDTEHRFQK